MQRGAFKVELAQLRYQLPRLLGRGSACRGRAVASGPAARAKPSWKTIQPQPSHRTLLRDQRQLNPTEAGCGISGEITPGGLVGYTNAIKSVCSMPYVASEPVIACWRRTNCLPPWTPPPANSTCLPGARPQRLLLTDTVGFIRDLPPTGGSLPRHAGGSPGCGCAAAGAGSRRLQPAGHLDTVHRLLDDLGSTALRRVIANKIDRCEARNRAIHRQNPMPCSSPLCAGTDWGCSSGCVNSLISGRIPAIDDRRLAASRADQRSSEPSGADHAGRAGSGGVLFITGVIALNSQDCEPEPVDYHRLLNPQEALAGFGSLPITLLGLFPVSAAVQKRCTGSSACLIASERIFSRLSSP